MPGGYRVIGTSTLQEPRANSYLRLGALELSSTSPMRHPSATQQRSQAMRLLAIGWAVKVEAPPRQSLQSTASQQLRGGQPRKGLWW
jgi:hypothetical protein